MREALVSGAGRRQPLVVLELDDGIEVNAQTIPQLGDTVVEGMNQKLPTFGRIARTHMLILMVAKAIERQFAAQTDGLYSQFGDERRGDSDRYGSVAIETTICLSTSASNQEETS